MGVRKDLRRIRRLFRRDERGGVLVTAALSMLPITLLTFAAVEFHNFNRQKIHLQDALDAAALAVARAPESATAAELRTLYTAVLKGHLKLRPGLLTLVEAEPDPVTGEGGQPELTVANGRVTANATVAISPIVASFFINGDVRVSGRSEVLREVLGTEIALVLDTTGSMNDNDRIGTARLAATNFVTALETAAAHSNNPEDLKIGLVPFAATVNIGAAYSNQPWMDRNAQSPIHDDIFLRRDRPYTTTGRTPAITYAAETWSTPPNRWTFLSNMGATWGGCVESRPYPHDVRDTAPSVTVPETLFVPYFHPDQPDTVLATDNPWWSAASNTNVRPNTLQPQAFPNSYLEDLRRMLRTYDGGPNLTGAPWFGFDMSPGNYPGSTADNNAEKVQYAFRDLQRYIANGFLQNGNADPFWYANYILGSEAKYRSPTGMNFTGGKGPNYRCTVKPIVRLTSQLSSVKTAIGTLTADGSTNIPMGLAWGYHLLSPKGPFADGVAYNTPKRSKIVVLMTDGDNAVPALEYTGLGYAALGRAGTTTTDNAVVAADLNKRMRELCTNMKSDGIIIYAVRVEVVGGDPSHLQWCASDEFKYFEVTDADDLDETFQEIARSIQQLRIAS